MGRVPVSRASSLAVPTLIDGGTSISFGQVQKAPSSPPTALCHGIAICIIALRLADERDRPDD